MFVRHAPARLLAIIPIAVLDRLFCCVQVSWQGTDSVGRPVLLVRLSRACDEFDGKEAAECAEAIISQVRGVSVSARRLCRPGACLRV